jgi:spore coat protein CotH
MSSSTEFLNKPPPSRQRRNLISCTIIIIITVSTVLFFVYFPYPDEKDSDDSDDEPDFPTIYITCYSKLDNENYSSCIFELDSSKSSEKIDPLEAKIRIRGETSATYPKVGYRIELSKNEPLLGMRDDDDWQLFASYYDYTRLKIKFSFNLWRNLLSVDSTAILPRSRYVLLYFNGQFQGLYLLAEKDDRKLFGLDINAQNNNKTSLIFQAKDYTNISQYESDKWEQDWPNEDEGFYVMDEIMTELITFINSTSDIEFFNSTHGIFTKFDEINLIDFYLFNFFILHEDFWDKNYYIIRDTYPSNFSLVPWDFDVAFGQNATKIYDNKINPEYNITLKNKLYDRLLSNQSFRENCSDRWFKLRNDIWSNETIFNILSVIYNECKDYIQTDLKLWNQPYLSENYIEQLKDWISDRLAFCDDHFKT